MMGEFFFNRYDSPLRDAGLSNTGIYAQAVYTVLAQWDVSLRYDQLRHETVEDSAGNRLTWDQNVFRFEGGVTYRVTRDLRVKAIVQDTDTGNGFGSDNLIPALQVAFSF
jgi:hypothetical protein